MKELIKETWYQNLLEDLKKIEFTSIVIGKLAYGNRILKDELKFGKPEYGSKRIENIAKDLEISISDVYNCKKFAEKVRDSSEFSNNVRELQLNWRKIVLEYLYDKRNDIKLLPPPKLPTGKFDIILADPPWKYDFAPTSSTQIEQHYDTMETEDICNLQIPSANNAVLFLWATAPKLEQGMRVLNAWGFEYKTCGIWDKVNKGMGYWFLGQHELLLVGTKGNFSPPAPDKRVSSVYSEKKTKHSKKPDYFYNLIEQMFPNGKYLELFARQKYNDKWTVWGHEAPQL